MGATFDNIDAPPDPLAELVVGHPCVELKWSPSEGRHLAARREIAAGEVVLSAKPFASTTYTDNGDAAAAGSPPRARWCAGCLRFRQNAPVPCVCSACGLGFCSEKCRAHAEELGLHSATECAARAALRLEQTGASARDHLAGAALLIGIACRAAAEPPPCALRRGSVEPRMEHVLALAPLPPRLPTLLQDGASPAAGALDIFRRWQDAGELDAQEDEMARAAADALIHAGWRAPPTWPDAWCGPGGPMPSDAGKLAKALSGIHSRILCNCFGLTAQADDGAEVGAEEGWAVFPAASLFNHSCVPSLYWEFAGKAADRGRIVFRALRPVPEGAPLTICYGRSAGRQPHAVRVATMRDHWRFQCRCERCLAIDDVGDDGTRFADFDSEFVCRRCYRIGPARGASGPAESKGGRARPKGCSCLPARNRLAG